MFSVNITHPDQAAHVVLKDESNGTIAEIIPSCGAILHRFAIPHQGALLNLIDPYHDAADFHEHCTAKGFKGCKLSPFVCRMKEGTYHHASQTYKIEKFYLGKHALHGLLYDAPFVITEQHADQESAFVVSQFDYTGTDKGYPFQFTCKVRYELRSNHQLLISTELTNTGKASIPVSDGWHPYFSFGGKIDDLHLEFQSKYMLEFDDALLPTGNLIPYDQFNSLKKIEDQFFDNCFVLNFDTDQPLCVIRDEVKKLQLEIRPERSYPYLQIYTPPHRNSIAIENLSAAPDAFNNGIGLIELAPADSVSFVTHYILSYLS